MVIRYVKGNGGSESNDIVLSCQPGFFPSPSCILLFSRENLAPRKFLLILELRRNHLAYFRWRKWIGGELLVQSPPGSGVVARAARDRLLRLILTLYWVRIPPSSALRMLPPRRLLNVWLRLWPTRGRPWRATMKMKMKRMISTSGSVLRLLLVTRLIPVLWTVTIPIRFIRFQVPGLTDLRLPR